MRKDIFMAVKAGLGIGAVGLVNAIPGIGPIAVAGVGKGVQFYNDIKWNEAKCGALDKGVGIGGRVVEKFGDTVNEEISKANKVGRNLVVDAGQGLEHQCNIWSQWALAITVQTAIYLISRYIAVPLKKESCQEDPQSPLCWTATAGAVLPIATASLAVAYIGFKVLSTLTSESKPLPRAKMARDSSTPSAQFQQNVDKENLRNENRLLDQRINN